MKKSLLLSILLVAVTLFVNPVLGQSCADCRYLSPVFDSVVVDTGIHFAHGLTAKNQMQELYMDIYHPYGDTVKNRPLVIFAFGGAFIRGTKRDWYVEEACKLFARSGYVAAAIDYRVGIEASEILSLQFMRIFFRPMQDMRAAVQYFKADYSERGNNYNIDTSRIIISGASSGGITALMNAYCDKPSEISEMGNISALDVLGGFYSTSSLTDTNYSYAALGCVSVAGAIINANWIEPGNMPVVMAHGDADQVVPYKKGGLSGIAFGFDLQGSYVVDTAARNRGVCSYLFTMAGHDHPNEDMGIEYVRSVVYRLMQRMHAVVNQRSFCCPLQVDVQPNDTLFFAPGDPATNLTANVTADSGSAQLQWCSIGCGYTSTAANLNFTPDTIYKYIIATATENQCEQGDLYILIDSTQLETGITHINRVQFSVYPQPASVDLYVTADLRDYTNKPISLQVFDVTGKHVLTQPISVTSNEPAKVNISALVTGNYFAVLKAEREILGVKKVAIQR